MPRREFAGDPRRDTGVVPYEPATSAPDGGLYYMVAFAGSMGALVLRSKAAAWVALFASLLSAFSDRASARGSSSGSRMSSVTLALTSLAMTYMAELLNNNTAAEQLRAPQAAPKSDVASSTATATPPGTPSIFAPGARSDSEATAARSINLNGLSWPSVGAQQRRSESAAERDARLQKMSGAVRTLLECIGEDPDREGLLKTPERYAKALMFLTKGYDESIGEVINEALFDEDHEEMVIVRDIDIFSLCEHHLVPFCGKVAIGYIPNRRVLGLSKLARIAEMFSRRLQIQERLTKQIATALEDILQPQGVAVLIEASHQCMVMRGVQKPGSKTITSFMLGRFRTDPKTREEFLSLVK
ncbi:hypothetical protein H4R18_003099 [Coemansia javaensis]|uniref:GTP cyclohydrolase 1 n=1 Tax=Coemansia javaensis TaxID=2761396 RepID=A0A9W8LHU1_9FUNG|nr:hypothetical protein H4R18_003099 [Coemansia javaensis]